MKAILSPVLAILALAFVPLGNHQAVAEQEAQRVSQFSGKPVPRFESLRYSAVHGRQGPSLDHPILWRYERTGLPMLVVRETHGWRRVRDPDGDEVWMQARMLSPDPTAVLMGEAVMRRKPDVDAAGVAQLKPGVIVELEACEGAYCQVKADRLSGWIERGKLWGVETDSAGL
ncbi:MAG: SH3 domain-containing protein [Pseudomonadota bacterium]